MIICKLLSGYHMESIEETGEWPDREPDRWTF